MRTRIESSANALDERLYNAIFYAEAMMERDCRSSTQDRVALLKFIGILKTARPIVRAMMHADDRKGTD